MLGPPGSIPQWAVALREAVPALGRGAFRERVWRLLHAALFASLRAQAGRLALTAADFEDLASARALDLLARAESGDWKPGAQSARDLAAFVRAEARAALADLARRRSLACPPPSEEARWNIAARDPLPPESGRGDWTGARGAQNAIGDCVRELAPADREVWFLSTCLERAPEEIAAVTGMSAAAVTRTAARAGEQFERALAARGQSGAARRPGAFAVLWSEWQERQP